MYNLMRTLFIGCWLLAGFALPAQANKLLMPGEVIQGHAKEEENCEKCHKKFDKAAQDGLCSDCHKAVARDIAEKRGYHGRIEPGRSCRECHTEHKGRDARIVVLDKGTFDHTRTDFLLKGRHADAAKVKCEDCHKPGRKYAEAPNQCVGCHKKEDDKTHKGSLGSDCAKCHSEKDWKATSIDHDRFDFKLRGRHADVKCEKCHLDDRFKETPQDCYSCHKKDDERAHQHKVGNKCQSCHVERGWKEIIFDHDRMTKYPLLGKHREVKCTKCHTDNRFKDTPGQCAGCHKKEDEKAHRGRFGNKCETCHVEKDWKAVKFDHARTRFPLLGKHADPKVKCTDCHKGDLYRDKLERACIACHRKEDDQSHKGQEGKQCERCHNAESWKKTTFDHNRMSNFPLLGRHFLVPCRQCHQGLTFKDAKSDCWSCHEKDDAKVHKRRLGTECQTCHNTRDWMAWDFDHDKTDFRLDGPHRKTARKCYACHDKPMDVRVEVSTVCGSCHARDDIHNGSYGDRCDRCHMGDDWKQIRPDMMRVR